MLRTYLKKQQALNDEMILQAKKIASYMRDAHLWANSRFFRSFYQIAESELLILA